MFCGITRKNRVLWLLAGTSLITLVLLHQVQQTWKPFLFEKNEFLGYDLAKEEPIDPEQKCQLPRVHPFDPSILGYLTPSKEIHCKDRQGSLTYINSKGVLRLNDTALKLGGYEDKNLVCYYQEISRTNDFAVSYGEKRKLDVNGSKVESDFIYVSCTTFAGIAFYTNIHCHVFPKKNYADALNSSGDIYNILIIGIDSLSRLSFIRQLPRTYKFLTKNLNAFVFRGMTKVGDNTFPNLAAIFTGKSVFGNELPRVQDPEGTYDEWPCIWKNFSEAGYATFFAEDRPDIGLFTYLRGGLRNPPTDHYMRPFWLAVQHSRLHLLSSNMCFGGTPKHVLQLRYTRDFVAKYRGIKRAYFAFSFLVELSHDYVSQVSAADEDLESLLKDLSESGDLNRTFLFFLSDHGHRFDAMRATLIGRIEERMPFVALVVPPVVQESHLDAVSNLQTNQGRLTTPYDIYFTALDILRHSVNGTQLGTATSSRGTSLFGPVSLNRTCSTAGIPDHYCTCETEKSLEISDPRSRKAANALVATINDILRNSNQGNFCAELSITEIVRSDLIVLPREVIVNSRIYFGNVKEDDKARGMISKLRVIIKTSPGGALFEATLLNREDEDNIYVLGDISRINKYGSQSSCIDNATLRKYCYCTNSHS